MSSSKGLHDIMASTLLQNILVIVAVDTSKPWETLDTVKLNFELLRVTSMNVRLSHMRDNNDSIFINNTINKTNA